MARNAVNERTSRPARSGETVTVACKMPHGLVLQLQQMQEVRVPAMGGGFVIEKQFRPTGDQIVIKGNAVPVGVAPSHEIAGGYALTPGVPKDFWETWLEQNAELDLVKRGLIFAESGVDRARDAGKEQKATRSGLEPLNGTDPAKDPRVPKSRFKVEVGTTGEE